MRLFMSIFVALLSWTAMGLDVPRIGAEMGITNGGWSYYSGNDALEGGYLCQYNAGPTNAVVSLGQEVPAGTYLVFVRLGPYFNGAPWDDTNGVGFTIGEAQAGTNYNSVDFNLQWTKAVSITASEPFSNITVTHYPSNANFQKILIRALYLTDRTGVFVDANGYCINLPVTYPAAITTAAVKGNLLENSSFEIGMSHGWCVDSTTRDYHMMAHVVSTQAHSGTYSRIIYANSAAGEVISKPILLRPNRSHTLSCYVKAMAENTVDPTVRLSLENMYIPPTGFAPRVGATNTTTIPRDGEWHRVSVTSNLWAYPEAFYRIRLAQPAGRGCWFDSVQLEEGSLTDYAPIAVECGLISTREGNVFWTNEANVLLVTRNSGSNAFSGNAELTIYDWNNAVQTNRTIALSVPAESTVTNEISLLTGKTGHFRAFTRITGRDRTQSELCYGVIPTPTTTTNIAESRFGIHADSAAFTCSTYTNMGIYWARSLSPTRIGRWSLREPTNDVYNWEVSDVEIAGLSNANMSILVAVGDESIPAWATALRDSDEDAFVAEYAQFASNVVVRYGAYIKQWELVNEANSTPIPNTSATLYAKIIKAGTEAILAVDSDAVLSINPNSFGFATNTIAALDAYAPGWNWTNDIDFVTAHLYTAPASDGAKWLATVLPRQRTMMTEAGNATTPSNTGAEWGFVSYGFNVYAWADSSRLQNGYRLNPIYAGTNWAHVLGQGFEKYFYYDGRLAEYLGSGSELTLLSPDDTVKLQGIQFAIARHFIDHSERIATALTNAEGYVFSSTRDPVAWVWSTTTNRTLTVTNAVQVYDSMGNLLSDGTNVNYHRLPVFIVGAGLTAAQLTETINSGEVATIADTNAPTLIVCDSPSGLMAGERSAIIRWLAFDDYDFPGSLQPNSLLYSYQLEGRDAEFSAWTAATSENLNNLSGSYRLAVKAKDVSGNESSVVYSPQFYYATRKATLRGSFSLGGKVTFQ